MSPADASTLVKLDDTIQLPAGVAAAFTRSRGVFHNSDAFVDRAYQTHADIDQIIAWRYAGVITNEQCSALLRKVRRDFEQNPGVVSDHEWSSALEVDEREAELEQVYLAVDSEFAADRARAV